MGLHFLDIHAAAKTSAFCPDEDTIYIGVASGLTNDSGQGHPSFAVKGVYRRNIENKFGNFIGDGASNGHVGFLCCQRV